MKAMVLEDRPGTLRQADLPEPEAGPGRIRIRVSVCGICRTDLHLIDGELDPGPLPVTPGHQIVGRVEARGPGAERFEVGQRVGVPWLAWACGVCEYCRSGRENLCPRAEFTGYTVNGGYAELAVADEAFAFALPERFTDVQAAPLLCAGMIGYRALRIAGDGRRIGMFGFGSSAHLLCQVAVEQGREVYAFTRPGDLAGQGFARQLGATWAGGSDETPPRPLDAAIVFAPVGELMVRALELSGRGARVVSAGIHMSDIPSFPYELMWEERSLHSVANLTRRDGEEFLRLAAEAGVEARVTVIPFSGAQAALEDLRRGEVEGSLVLDLQGLGGTTL